MIILIIMVLTKIITFFFSLLFLFIIKVVGLEGVQVIEVCPKLKPDRFFCLFVLMSIFF